MLFIGCDPDTKHSAYAVVDEEGKVVDAYTIESDGSISDLVSKHAYDIKMNLWSTDGQDAIAYIEGQVVYKNDAKSNPADLIKLARASGVSAMYLAQITNDITVLDPIQWKGTVPKHIHQARILKELGYESENIQAKGSAYCIPTVNFLNLTKTQYKHVIDAIGLALKCRKDYMWNNRKKEILDAREKD